MFRFSSWTLPSASSQRIKKISGDHCQENFVTTRTEVDTPHLPSPVDLGNLKPFFMDPIHILKDQQEIGSQFCLQIVGQVRQVERATGSMRMFMRRLAKSGEATVQHPPEWQNPMTFRFPAKVHALGTCVASRMCPSKAGPTW